MPGLAETLAKLAAARRAAIAPGAGRMAEVAAFGPNPGALRMLTYAPDTVTAGAPLVVVLHGCTQSAEGHATAAGWLTLADRLGLVILAPEQTAANNPNRCFNWFEPDDASRGRGEAASIKAMIDHCLAHYECAADKVFVTGLSAGGAMAAVMLASYPETFAAGAVIAGAPFGAAQTMPEAFSVMGGGRTASDAVLAQRLSAAAPATGRLPRISIWHGDQDSTVRHSNAADTARQWAAAQGLSPTPDRIERLAGRIRSSWGAPGEEAVELNLVQGLGHGTPLASKGAEGLGAPAPYMLEAGISSSHEIAAFWGLAPRSAPLAGDPVPAAPAPATALDGAIIAAVGPYVSPDVRGVIERALKSAGLTR